MMGILRHLPIMAIPFILLASCEGGESAINEVPKELVVTGVATDVTEWSAKLSGHVNLTPDLGEVTMGVIYSTEETLSLDKGTILTSRELDDNDVFTVSASRLSSNSTYYYKSFVNADGVYRFGEVRQFKTLEICAVFETMPATDVTGYSATLNGKFTLESHEALPTGGVCFYYSDSIQDASELVGYGTKSSSYLGADGLFCSLIGDLSPSTTYYYVPFVMVYDKEIYGSVKSFQSHDAPAPINTHNVPADPVDLGLSVLWASYNLGASSPEEYGDYYAWGEIIPYYEEGHSQDSPCSSWRERSDHPITRGYNWASYKWCNGSETKLTRYNDNRSFGVVDNKTEFKDYDYADDAARAEWGSPWRIPTKDEFEELVNNCDSEWVTINGVKGTKYTSRMDNYTDKWIFFPAAGIRQSLNCFMGSCDYWVSSCWSSSSYVAYIASMKDGHLNSGLERYYGLPVRPVYEKSGE